MRPVQREEILDYPTYGERRDELRREAMRVKDSRRVHVGDRISVLFENRDTVRYQVQEMMRAERTVKEADILHELDTYNELLGGPGELGCTLLIEIDDPEQREVRLREWLDLPRRVYLGLAGGRRVYARFDPRQVGGDRLSSVQFLKFDTGGEVPEAVGTDLPRLRLETRLDQRQRQALAEDLAS